MILNPFRFERCRIRFYLRFACSERRDHHYYQTRKERTDQNHFDASVSPPCIRVKWTYLLNTEQYGRAWQAYVNDGENPNGMLWDMYNWGWYNADGNPVLYGMTLSNTWFKEIQYQTRTGWQSLYWCYSTYNLSVSNGSEKGSFFSGIATRIWVLSRQTDRFSLKYEQRL